jgi:hypothetical protein
MRKAFLFTGLLILFGLATFAKQIDEHTAKQVGQTFLAGTTSSKIVKNGDDLALVYKAEAAANGKYTKSQEETTYFYVFNAGTNGFVIVAGDDNVSPILGYSYESTFNPDRMPQNVMKWLEAYKNQIRYVMEQHIPATEQIQKEWENYYSGAYQKQQKASSVDPLIATKWNQGQYYNASCPGSGSNKAVTGCVATAMAQIMKYHNYPATGSGFHSYNHQTYGTLSANFGSTTYQWSSMPNNINSSNTAVATLMYHCGVSVDMNYSPESSGAYVILSQSPTTHCAEYAFKTYFGYKNTLQGKERINYNQTQWVNLLKTELEAGRPILYAGFGSGGGHAFVCDGFDNRDYFHFNWGWGGYYDGFFSINALNPSGTGIGGGTGAFNEGHQALIGIQPPTGGGGSTPSVDLKLYSNIIMSSTSIWFGNSISLSVDIANYGSSSFNGTLGAAVFNSEGTLVDFLSTKTVSLTNGHYSEYTFSNAGGPPFIPGDYIIAIVSKTTNTDWTIVGDGTNYMNYKQFNIYYSTAIEVNSKFSIQNNSGRLIQNETATINVDIWNNGSTTFYGKFRVSLSKLDGSFEQSIDIVDITTNGLQANYHYTNGVNFTGTISVAPGTYLMEMAYQRKGESQWYYAGSTNYQNPVFVIVEAPLLSPDKYEPNNTYSQAYALPVTFSGNKATINTTGSNFHVGTDNDYYKINLPTGYNYTLKPRLYDAYNGGNGKYTADALFSYSTNSGSTWSDTYDDVMTGNISMQNGGSIYFHVAPYFLVEKGTYLLEIAIDRIPITGIETIDISSLITVFPNPAQDKITIQSPRTIEQLVFYDLSGKMVHQIHNPMESTVDISHLAKGVYFLKIDNKVVKVVKE